LKLWAWPIWLDKAPHHLSAGQKRAAAIATILSMAPKIITLDEPDANLDPRNRNNLIKLLTGLSQTLIIATCNMNFAGEIADRAILLDKGYIIADGDAKKTMSNSELMTEHGLEVPAGLKEENKTSLKRKIIPLIKPASEPLSVFSCFEERYITSFWYSPIYLLYLIMVRAVEVKV